MLLQMALWMLIQPTPYALRHALIRKTATSRGPIAQQHYERATLAIADRIEFGIQTSFGAANSSGNSPFLSRLAAVRCALRWVASIIS